MKEFRKYSAETVPRNLKLGIKWEKFLSKKEKMGKVWYQ